MSEKGELNEKHEVLIRQLNLKFGLKENEKNLIRNVREPRVLDTALDAFATGTTKSDVLEKLIQS